MAKRVDIQTVHVGALGAAFAPIAPRVSASPRCIAHGDVADAAALIDARVLGASLDPIDELGVVLARGVAALRDGAEDVHVRLALGSDFLMQIAKLRALRCAWARVGEQVGVDVPLHIWAGPDAATWTVHDPWVNLLRGTASTFAALVGGADDVTPLPYDAALGTPDAHARRLADNTFHVLVDEGQLAAVDDPAAGSWAIEAWTQAVAAQAWEVLVALDAAPPEAIDAFVAARAEALAAERDPRIVKRLDGILGTSLHPNLDEVLPARSGARLDRGPARALPFEALRARAAACSKGPTVFLAGLGALAEHSVRLGWVKGLYEVASIRALGSPVSGETFDDAAACVASYRASGASVVCLCGSDAAYARLGQSFVAALKEAGARVVLAGRPKDLELAVDAKVYAGMDVVAALAAELTAQGVA